MRAIPGGGTFETAAEATGCARNGGARKSIPAQSGSTQRNKAGRNKGSLGIGRLLPLYIRMRRQRFDDRRPSHFRVGFLDQQISPCPALCRAPTSSLVERCKRSRWPGQARPRGFEKSAGAEGREGDAVADGRAVSEQHEKT